MAAILPASDLDSLAEPSTPPPARRRVAPWADTVFAALAKGAAWLTLLLMVGIIGSLLMGAAPAIKEFGLAFLWTNECDPVQDKYAGLAMIYGTLATSGIALLFAVVIRISNRQASNRK